MKYHQTVDPQFVKKCWHKAGLLPSLENIEVAEASVPVDPDVVLVAELTARCEAMILKEQRENLDIDDREEEETAVEDESSALELTYEASDGEPDFEVAVIDSTDEEVKNYGQAASLGKKSKQKKIRDFFCKK